MTRRKISLVFALAIVACVSFTPSLGQNKAPDQAFGFLFADASCAQAAYALTSCPCSPPVIDRYVFSTKIDLSRYAGHFVTLRGTSQSGICGVGLFEVKKATIEPNISCPCPASIQEVNPTSPVVEGVTSCKL